MDKVNIIFEFADNYFTNGNLKEQLVNLKNLSKYIFFHNINSEDIDDDTYTFLLSNEKINNMVKSILTQDDYRSSLGNDFFYSLALAYSEKNGIELRGGLDVDSEKVSLKDFYANNVKNIDSLKLYFKEVDEYRVLTPLETKDLFIQYESAEGEAKKTLRDTIVNHNLRLVLGVAKKYYRNNDYKLDLEDMIQEGNIGLVKAVEKYKLSFGTQFSTHATWWIRQSITRAIADQSRTIRVPVYANEIILKMNRFIVSYNMDNGVDPTSDIIAEELQIPEDKVKFLRGIQELVSLDTPLMVNESGADLLLSDSIVDKKDYIADALSRITYLNLAKTIRKLNISKRDQNILIERYGLIDGEFRTLKQIGKKYGITRERVRQVEEKALDVLKYLLTIKGHTYEDYIDENGLDSYNQLYLKKVKDY